MCFREGAGTGTMCSKGGGGTGAVREQGVSVQSNRGAGVYWNRAVRVGATKWSNRGADV